MTARSRFESQSDSVPAQSHSSLGAIHGPASYSSLSRGPGSFFSEFSGDLNNFFTVAGPSKQAFQSSGADFSQTQSADTHGLSGLRLTTKHRNLGVTRAKMLVHQYQFRGFHSSPGISVR
uniref:Uncharacterized protein n=1 Tax=Timema shepardi TaxID=629360 RepID=A0A7R9AZU9_TIMSH|nr:unnamed protein product [Timema shepardi]